MKILGIKLLVILIAVMSSSLVMFFFYLEEIDQSYPWPENVFPKSEIVDKFEIVKLGNSHPGDGITFEKYNVRGLDLTGPSQELRYDLAKLKHYSNQIDEGAVILIAVTPISFSQSRSDKDDALQRSYYGQISPVFLPYIDYGDYLLDQFMPFLQTGYLWRREVAKKVELRLEESQRGNETEKEKIEAREEVATPTATVAKPIAKVKMRVPRSEMYFNMEAIKSELASPNLGKPELITESMHAMFAKWLENESYSPDNFADNIKDLERLITYSLSKKWKPVLVTVPISKVLEEGLTDDYKEVYIYQNLEKAKLKGVDYFDFSVDETPKGNASFFSNSDHLNKDGAALFSYLLLRKLIDEGYLPESADGYDYGPLYVEVD